jgi:hypothetical protein
MLEMNYDEGQAQQCARAANVNPYMKLAYVCFYHSW